MTSEDFRHETGALCPSVNPRQRAGHREPANPTPRILPTWRALDHSRIHRPATGKHGERDEFKVMFQAASRREFEAVLVWALDRLTREGILSTFLYVKRLADYGVKFISYSEPQFSTTSNGIGELMIALAAWIAAQERIRISERTRRTGWSVPARRAPATGSRSRKAPAGIPSRSGPGASQGRAVFSGIRSLSRLHASPTAIRRAHAAETALQGACPNPSEN